MNLDEQPMINDFIYTDDFIRNTRHMDLKFTLPDYYLRKVDCTSMLNSLEVRVPFISKEILSVMNSVPVNLQYNMKSGKYLLKKAFENDILPQILKRGKKGFTRSWYMLFGDNTKSILFDTITSAKIADLGIFNMNSLEKLVVSFNPRNVVANNLLWRLLVFGTWYNNLGT